LGKSAAAQPPPSATQAAKQAVAVTLDITSTSPANPVAGQAVTVNYTIQLYSILGTPVEGYVTGDFQGIALQQPNAASVPTVSLQPSQPVTGSLVIPAPAAGPGVLSLGFYRGPVPAGCKGKFANVSHCSASAIASATANLNIAEPIVQVRISGATYAHISRPDSRDQTTDNNGYLYVMHDPGCGWWGNDGKDMFFDQKALPAGATLIKPNFDQYWPLGIDSSSGSGAWTWFDSSGTYYAHLNGDDPGHPYVKWNNTCAGGFGGKNLWYSISFVISMPKGTQLGEPTYDPGLQAPYVPDRYSPVPVVIGPVTNQASGWEGQVFLCNPGNTAADEYLHIRATLATPNSGAQGSAGPMVEDNLPLQFAPGGVSGSVSGFKTALTYKRGTWKITDVYLTTAQAFPANAAVKNAVHLLGLPANPISAVLPGNIGSPIFDFRGGSCP